MSELSHLKVIILRSRQDECPLAGALSARGGRVYQLPVQSIEVLADDDTAIQAQIQGIGNYQKAIFVSRNAAQAALSWLDRYSLSLALVGQCFAIGPTSAALLEARGIEVEHPLARWNSEALLALPAMQDVCGEKIIIFRGQGGLPLLGEALAERGALVEFCELYLRQQDTTFKHQIMAILAGAGPSVMVAHSGSILDALVAMGGVRYRQLICSSAVLVPGIRLQQYAQEIGFQKVIVATTALADDIERALSDWYTQTL